MDLKSVKTASLVELICYLHKISNVQERNSIIYEITCRMYVPFNSDITFEELLIKNGYKQENQKTKKIFDKRKKF